MSGTCLLVAVLVAWWISLSVVQFLGYLAAILALLALVRWRAAEGRTRRARAARARLPVAANTADLEKLGVLPALLGDAGGDPVKAFPNEGMAFDRPAEMPRGHG